MILFAILMSFHSCQKKANVEITNVVEEWINREIKFDDGYIFTRLGKDSILLSEISDNRSYPNQNIIPT